jgi:hypothetical protein
MSYGPMSERPGPIAAHIAPHTALRPLGLPRSVEVRVDAGGLPAAVARRRGEWRRVEQVDDVWRVAEEWWRETPQERTYVRLILEGGRPLTLFHDGLSGAWYQQQYGSAP